MNGEPEDGAETQASRAYAQLKADIIGAKFGAGEKLRVRHLCELYGMGVSPIREALNRASRDGLVKQTDLRGFTTAPLSEQDLFQLTKTRCWVNEVALRQSIISGTSEWEERIVVAHFRMARTPRHLPAQTPVRNQAWEKAHRAFHASLIAACDSPWLIGFCEQLFDVADRYRFLWSTPGPEAEKASDDIHADIMRYTLDRNADAAVKAMNAHFMAAAERAAQSMARLAED
jgi:DNA-binding GntR family transcriptional regulator